MAVARKCDRCGECFDIFNQTSPFARFQNPFFQNSADLKETKVSHRLLKDAGPDTYVDLCPKCAWLFERFMENCSFTFEPLEKIDVSEFMVMETLGTSQQKHT